MMTHLPSPDEPSPTHAGDGPPELVSSQLFQSPSTIPSDQAEESFYTFEDEPFDLIGTPWVAPFEHSNEMPSLSAGAHPSRQRLCEKSNSIRSRSGLMFASRYFSHGF